MHATPQSSFPAGSPPTSNPSMAALLVRFHHVEWPFRPQKKVPVGPPPHKRRTCLLAIEKAARVRSFCKRARMACTHPNVAWWCALRAAPECHPLITLVCSACHARGHVLSSRMELGSMAAGARVTKPFSRVNAGMKKFSCAHTPFVFRAWKLGSCVCTIRTLCGSGSVLGP